MLSRFIIKTSFLLAILTGISAPAPAAEKRFVSADFANVRLCPSTSCPSTNKYYKGQVVEIYEVKGKWSRISDFYDSVAERAEFPSVPIGLVAQWIRSDIVSKQSPAKLEQPVFEVQLADPRIKGIPDVGEYGLTLNDVTILRKYSTMLLKNEKCVGIEYGDKSVTRKAYYYVDCVGESQHRFFKSDDVK